MSPSRAAPTWVHRMAELLDAVRLETMSPGWDLFLVLTGSWYATEPWGEATDIDARIRVMDAIGLWIQGEPEVALPFIDDLVVEGLYPLPRPARQQLLGPVVADVGELL